VARTFRRTVLSVRALPEHVVARFAANPEAAFADARVLKAGNSATVVRSELGGRPCVIKRYNRKSLWQVLRRALRPVPRYRRAWRNGQALHLLGIPTARPLVLVERRVGPWRGVAYLVMEDLGDADLASELAGTGAADQRLEAAVALLRALAVAGLVHGDTKASNFLVHGERVAVVDLDAMRLGGRGQRRDLVRFLANFDGRPALRARCATLLGAVGLAPDREVGFAPPRRPL
jgi:tRNA A-37 threonylcarbamoyl transferase component Bud32